MSRPVALAVLLASLSISLGLSLAPAAPAGTAGLCERFGEGAVAGTVRAPLTEVSGVVASTRHAGVLWAHDDSGGEAALTALAEDGADLGTFVLSGAEAYDWEDIAATDGALFAGDIGDNRARRDSVTVYRVPEPAPRPDGSGTVLGGVQTIELRYPTGPVDAEALVVDPVTGDLYVLTKEPGTSRVLRAPAASITTDGAVDMELVASFAVPRPRSRAFGLPGTYVTGADVAPDGSFVLVRTYRSILAFGRPPGSALHQAFAAEPCEVPQIEEGQGEAVAVVDGGDGYVTIAEGEAAAIHRFGLRPAPPPTDTRPASPGAGTADRRERWALAAGGIGLALVLSVLALSRRRGGRRRTPGSRRP